MPGLVPLPPLVGIALVLALLGAALGLFRWLQVQGRISPEASRKGVHVSMGVLTLSFPWLFGGAFWPVAVLAGVAFVAMLALRVGPLRRSVGGVLHDVGRESVGDLAFPLAVVVLYALASGEPVLYAIPILLLGLADPAAALVGVSYGRAGYETVDGHKSREGSLVFAAVAFLCVHVPLLLATDIGRAESLLVGAIVAVLVSMLEATAWRGLDNAFVPLGAYAILVQLVPMPLAGLTLHFAVVVVIFGLAAVLRRRTTLGGGAVVGAALVAYTTWAVGGWAWLVAPALVYLLYTRVWWSPASELDAERPHTVLSVLSVTSVGVAWLLAAWALGEPRLIVPYAAAYAGSLAMLGVERLGDQRAGWNSRRVAVQRTALAAAPSAVIQASGVAFAVWLSGEGDPLAMGAAAFVAGSVTAGIAAWSLSRWGHVMDGADAFSFASRARRALVVAGASAVGLLVLFLVP